MSSIARLRHAPPEFMSRYEWVSATRLTQKRATNAVYALKHTRTQEVRVAKVIRASSSHKISVELEMLTLLKHPNIVRYYESFQNEHVQIIVTERCEMDFIDYVQRSERGFLEERECSAYIAQLVSALLYCHANLVAHRDIKLDNLFLAQDRGKRLLKLGDFGFSRGFDPLERSTTFCGSEHYTPPEIAVGAKYSPFHADLWSLGVAIAAMALGRFPFANEDQFFDMLHGAEPNFARRIDGEHVSETLQDLVRSLLRLKPSERLALTHVKQHLWLAQEQIQAHLPHREPMPSIERALVEQVASLGFDEDEVWRRVIANDCNEQCVAIYHLLCERALQETRARAAREQPTRIASAPRALSDSELSRVGMRSDNAKKLNREDLAAPSTPPPLLRKLLPRRMSRRRLARKSTE